ncbi:MAG: zf-HC2 domain-containing protein [Burkholderiaceae bacterium]
MSTDDARPDIPAPHDARADHLRAWGLLPWVVNGRATAEQAQWVDAHVAGCDDCRAELAWQRSLRDAIAAPPAVAAGDPEAALQRLMARLDVPAEAQPLPPAPAPAGGPRYLTQALVAAVVVQAVGLGLLSLHLWPGAGHDAAPGYQTLSEPAAAAGTLRVLPDGAMTQADWRALLQAQGLQVVAGPNAAGAYALAPAAGTGALLPRDQALARLRASPGVRLAEPIGEAP